MPLVRNMEALARVRLVTHFIKHNKGVRSLSANAVRACDHWLVVHKFGAVNVFELSSLPLAKQTE